MAMRKVNGRCTQTTGLKTSTEFDHQLDINCKVMVGVNMNKSFLKHSQFDFDYPIYTCSQSKGQAV